MLVSKKQFASGVCIFSVLINLEARRNLPTKARCSRDQNLSNCARRVLEGLRQYLVRGIPELRLPSIDPMRVKKITRTQRDSNLANYEITLTNLEFTGAKNFQILDIAIDPDQLSFRLKVGFPWLELDSDADIDGVVVGFAIIGQGLLSVKYTNAVVDIVLFGRKYESEAKEFIRWTKEDAIIDYEEAHYVRIEGFFEDPRVTKIFTHVANNSVRLLGKSFRAAIDLSVVPFIVNAINRVHAYIPTDSLYPVSVD